MADSGIAVPYNERLKPLDELLARVRQPGDFFVHGLIECPLPRLEIDDIGTVSFPVPQQQAKALVKLCERAPYGHGRETLVDTRVRKVRQLAPSKLRLAGKAWPRTLDRILATVTEGLGCGSAKVRAELYKLLVYDRGSFFKPHRDTEKADGMFGTLLIVLPSAHAGGDLVVRHAGREASIDLSGADFSELAFAAFYADCEHEVLPVTQGHRVCLVYNLMLERKPSKQTQQELLSAPDHRAEVAAAAEQLEQAFRGTEAPPKLVWLLEHQYSPAGLAFAALKTRMRRAPACFAKRLHGRVARSTSGSCTSPKRGRPSTGATTGHTGGLGDVPGIPWITMKAAALRSRATTTKSWKCPTDGATSTSG